MKIAFDNLPRVVFDYISYLSATKGRSVNTLDGYARDITLFLKFILSRKNSALRSIAIDEIDIMSVDETLLKAVTLQDGSDFLFYCQVERHNNERTRARKATTLRMYFKYLTSHKFLFEKNPFDDLELPRTKKSLPKHLTLDQSRALLSSADGEFKERNYAILTIFLNCGVRLSELCSLNLTDINYEDKCCKITGKGNKERMVYLNDACIYAIRSYVAVRPNDSVKSTDARRALFLSRNGNRISRRMVEQLVTDCLNKSGLANQGFSTHKLRHTAATLMYQHGHVDIRVLQEILGHENLGTTEIYTHVSSEQVRRAAESNPLADIKGAP